MYGGCSRYVVSAQDYLNLHTFNLYQTEAHQTSFFINRFSFLFARSLSFSRSPLGRVQSTSSSRSLNHLVWHWRVDCHHICIFLLLLSQHPALEEAPSWRRYFYMAVGESRNVARLCLHVLFQLGPCILVCASLLL